MSLIVNNEGREPARRIIRRFSSILRQTGIPRRAKEIRFWKRPLSKAKEKLAAIRRSMKREEASRLEKEGKI